MGPQKLINLGDDELTARIKIMKSSDEQFRLFSNLENTNLHLPLLCHLIGGKPQLTSSKPPLRNCSSYIFRAVSKSSKHGFLDFLDTPTMWGSWGQECRKTYRLVSRDSHGEALPSPRSSERGSAKPLLFLEHGSLEIRDKEGV